MPDFATGDHAPQISEKRLRMMARVDDTMVLAEQFLTGEFGNLAELVVRVRDVARRVGNG
jgi:hypothetical protein